MNMKVKKLLMMNSPLILDKPINKKSEDILDFDIFSRNIVNMLRTVPKNESFNFALCGEWGSGKTSIMNLSIDILEKESLYNIIRFNPWNVIKKENLINEFFKQLKGVIYKETNDKKILIRLSNYYKILFESIPNTSFLTNLFKSLSLKYLRNNHTIAIQKEEIVKYLKNEYIGRPILIVIDDLDRLTNDEICEVLKLIREIANFPNVIYCVLFERNQVVNAIEKELGINSGEEYLRKFFQIQWMVPTIRRQDMNLFLLSLLLKNEVCNKELNIEMQKYYGTIFDNCIFEYAINIRDIKLLLNSFLVRFSLLYKWVNCVDLLALTSFELFNPNLYTFIRKYRTLLLSGKEIYKKMYIDNNKTTEDAINEELDELFKSYFDNSERIIVRKILSIMFPSFARLIGENQNHYNEKYYVTNRHICSSIFFDAYFLQKTDTIHSVEKGVLNQIVLSSSEKINAFFEKYIDKPKYLRNILMELSQEVINISSGEISDLLLKELFLLGNSLYEKQLQDIDNYTTLLKNTIEIIFELFRKLSQNKIYEFLNEFFIIENMALKIYNYVVYFINSISYQYRTQNSTSEDNLYITRNNFGTLINNIVTIFNNNAKTIQLFDESYKDVLFLFYVEHSQSDIDLYYEDDIKKSESLIHICLHVFNQGQKTVDELFTENFPQIKNILNRTSEIANYVNDGNFQNMPEWQKIRFARFVRDMNISQEMININIVKEENWKKLYNLVNI